MPRHSPGVRIVEASALERRLETGRQEVTAPLRPPLKRGGVVSGRSSGPDVVYVQRDSSSPVLGAGEGPRAAEGTRLVSSRTRKPHRSRPDCLLVETSPRRPLHGPEDALGDKLADLVSLDDNERALVLGVIDAVTTTRRADHSLLAVDDVLNLIRTLPTVAGRRGRPLTPDRTPLRIRTHPTCEQASSVFCGKASLESMAGGILGRPIEFTPPDDLKII